MNRSNLLILVLATVLITSLSIPSAGVGQGAQGDWWMFHHDPLHSGCSLYNCPSLPHERWVFPTGYNVDSSAAIGQDGTIYIGSTDFNLYALNPDGSLKWQFATGDAVESSPAIASDGTIYVGSKDHNVYAVNPDDPEMGFCYRWGDSFFPYCWD